MDLPQSQRVAPRYNAKFNGGFCAKFNLFFYLGQNKTHGKRYKFKAKFNARGLLKYGLPRPDSSAVNAINLAEKS